ncbi:hypothetical protein FBU30_000798 [Linnemannia zychae]|nr:hypothetical protein FBU30_000798 [Linnemannia zychae]
MADGETVSTSLLSISKSPTASISSPPSTANLFQSTIDSLQTPTLTQTPPSLNNPYPPSTSPPPTGIPIAVAAGGIAGGVVIIIAVIVWYYFRRRRQHRQRDAKPNFSILFPTTLKKSSQVDPSQPSSRSYNKDDDEEIGLGSVHHQLSIHNSHDLELALSHKDDPPSTLPPTSPPRSCLSSPIQASALAIPKSISILIPETKLIQDQKECDEQQSSNHVEIDMNKMDAEAHILVDNSDEIKSVNIPTQQEQRHVRIPISSSATETEPDPRISTDTIMPTVVPRKPKLVSRKSTDSVIQSSRGRISMCNLPPPPPPTIPPPAIPISNSGDSNCGGLGRISHESSNRSSIYSNYPSGRRTRSSTESSQNPHSRNSANFDSSANTVDGRRLSRRIIYPPNTPPPPTPPPPPPPVFVSVPIPALTQHQHSTVPPRRRHHRNSSQILSTSLFDKSDRSAISPPLSPLTVQIPRPSSRSFQSLLTINTQLTAENVQQYIHQPQKPALEICKPDSPTDSIFAVSPRSRRRSSSQVETHRIMIPQSPNNATASLSFSVPPVPPIPAKTTSLADHLPSSPSSPHSNSFYKRPVLSHQQSSSSLDNTQTDAFSLSANVIRRYNEPKDGLHNYHYYDSRSHSPEAKKCHQQQKQYRRRSMSLPTSPTNSSSKTESSSSSAPCDSSDVSRAASPSMTKDQELQAIIADAIAIAQAKSAAIETARQNNFHHQRLIKHQQHHRRLYPQMDSWPSTTPSTADSSRPGSPL